MTNLQKDAMAYSQAKAFLDEVRSHRDILTTQQMRTLKGQALSGDINGATKGLAKLVSEVRR